MIAAILSDVTVATSDSDDYKYKGRAGPVSISSESIITGSDEVNNYDSCEWSSTHFVSFSRFSTFLDMFENLW